MSKNKLISTAVIFAVSLFALWGCPKRADVSAVPEAGAQARAQKEAVMPETREDKERAAAAARGLQSVYFNFDQSYIRDDARSVMKANADWLKANPKAKVRIEGNCDERGAIEYNQALGQRRASSAKKYLTDLGISAGRISLISYGKEKPVCMESNEACWQKNRRADFVMVSE